MQNISSESVATAFTHPILKPITGHPSYQNLVAIHFKLNAIAASIFSNHGDGIHGLLAISVSPDVYLSTTEMAFAPPTNPGLHMTNINANLTPT